MGSFLLFVSKVAHELVVFSLASEFCIRYARLD